ncbi:hypothetical protein DFH27DRAFT_576585 [Peziza echinospora]|nr:hypothetical protein DFH27DRAFT_576585 [Peziza echinospora]
MTAEVLRASPMGLGYTTSSSNGQAYAEEYAELEKIVRLRDDVFAGKHPRFKPPHTTGATFSQKSQVAAVVSPKAERSQSQAPRAPPPVLNAPKHPVQGSRAVDSQISDVLLTKSDVLIKAENNLKRDRIERELKQQLEAKLAEDRLKVDGRDMDQGSEDLDVESILAQAQSIVNELNPQFTQNTMASRPGKKRSIDEANSDNMSIDQNFYDERPENLGKNTDVQKHIPMDRDRVEAGVHNGNNAQMSRKSGLPPRSEMVPSQNQEKTLNQWPGAAEGSISPSESRRGRFPPQHVSDRPEEPRAPSLPRARQAVQQPENNTVMRDASIRERPVQPPSQRRRSTVTRNDEPLSSPSFRAAPATNRHVAQDRVIDLRGEEVEQSPRDKPQLESRRSSNAYIKPEPGTRPPSAAGTIRRSPSLERTRPEAQPLRRLYYDYAEAPQYSYHHPLESPHIHPYDPYYPSASAYAYPPPPSPLEYSSRAYPRAYPPGIPIYDDFSRLYQLSPRVIPIAPPTSQLLPRPPAHRESSRAPERARSPSSSGMYGRRETRRQSRSLSPPGRLPEPTNAEQSTSEQIPSRSHSVAPSVRRDIYERPMGPPPPPPGHYIDRMHPGYYIPYPTERPVYYEDREYYPRPVSAYLTELPPPPREIREGSLAPRGLVLSAYRDRDYHYPQRSVMAPPPRPYPIEYREYRPELGRELEEGLVRRSIRVDERGGRGEEYIQASSVRPEAVRHPAYGLPIMPPPSPVLYGPSNVRTDTSGRRYVLAEDDRYFRERVLSEAPPPLVYRASSSRPEVVRREYINSEDERMYREPLRVLSEAERARYREPPQVSEQERGRYREAPQVAGEAERGVRSEYVATDDERFYQRREESRSQATHGGAR